MNNPKRNNGFKVPGEYFYQLEKKILEEVKEGVKIQNKFFVPYNYFENFELKILEKTKKFRSKKLFILFCSAVSIILITLISILFNEFNEKEIIKIDELYSDIENELRLNPSKAFEISRFIDNINYKPYNNDFNNFELNQFDSYQIYYNNSYNIYYEEADY